MIRYLCGCVLVNIEHNPTACPLHGRIAEPLEPIPSTTRPLLRAVLFTDEQLRAFAAWLERQTFPYDQLTVAQAARAVIARANTLTKD